MTLEDLFSPQISFGPGQSQPTLLDLVGGQVSGGAQSMQQMYNPANQPANFFKDPQIKSGTGQTDIMQLLQNIYGPNFRDNPEVMSMLGHFDNDLTSKIGFENLGKVLNSGRAAANYIEANQGLGIGKAPQRVA